MFFVGMVVLAANAGGAWSPIGDVTTTMLWTGGQITTGNIMASLILLSLTYLVVPLIFLSFTRKGKAEQQIISENKESDKTTSFERKLILALGIGALVFVPVFITITDLPPYMGMLFGVGILWIVTEIIHKKRMIQKRFVLCCSGIAQSRCAECVIFSGYTVSDLGIEVHTFVI